MTMPTPTIFKGLDVRTNLLGRDPNRASDMSNVYVNQSDELVSRPKLKNYTIPSMVGPIRGLQVASFKSYSDLPNATGIGPYKRYMLAYVSGSDDPVGASGSKRGEVLRINSLPAGTALGEDTTAPYTESATKNFRRMRAQYNLLAHRYGAPFIPNNPVRGDLVGDVAYFLGIYGLWKSDGLVTQRAGNPPGVAAFLGSGGSSRFYRTFLAHYDFSGQWVFGDYIQQTVAAGSGAHQCMYNFPNSSAYGDGQEDWTGGLWDATYIVSTGATNNGTPDGLGGYTVEPTELYVNSTVKRVEVGDYLTIYGAARTAISRNESKIWKIRVKAKGATTVTLDLLDIYVCDLSVGGGFSKATPTELNILGTAYFTPNTGITYGETVVVNSNYVMAVYASTAASSGYRFVGVGVADPDVNSGSEFRISTDKVDGASSSLQYYNYGVLPTYWNFTDAFEDCYDEAKVKGNLPITFNPSSLGQDEKSGTNFRFFAVYNGQILAATEHLIYWSDPASVGSTIENFDPNDNFSVGSMKDGPITGLFANDEFFVVHREFKSYYVTGNLLTGSLRQASIKDDRYGALSHWSQAPILDQNFFVSKKGAHAVTNSGNATEFGDNVQPIIRNELTATFGTFPRTAEEKPLVNCCVDDVKNHVYTFYDSDDVLVFNYRIKEWFKWKLPTMFTRVTYSYSTVNPVAGPFTDHRIIGGAEAWEGVLWTSDGSSLNVEDAVSTTPDAGYTTAYWASVFRDELKPSIEKRYTYLKLFGLDVSTSFDLSVGVRFDWESGAYDDQGSKTLPNPGVSPAQGFQFLGLEDRNSYSFQFKVSSTTALKLQGYQLEIHEVQGEAGR